MRVAVTIAQKADGKWEVLATPDVSIDAQKKAYKEEIVANSGKYSSIRLMVSKSSDKRYTFKPAAKAPAKKKVAKKKED
jgi:hypothetical protein